jgi:predicted extracellular nuclease
MNIIKRIYLAGAACLVLPGVLSLYPTSDPTGQLFERGDSITFMFYNCENLFDFNDDSDKDDEEFLPGGQRGWGKAKYYRKINAIAKVILSAGDWEPPAIIGLCEVENEDVIRDLIRLTPLNNYGYSFLYCETTDSRGIDICLLYREKYAVIESHASLAPAIKPVNENFVGRQSLYAKMVVTGQTLHIIINHWPSRRGGVLGSQQLRLAFADRLKEFSDSIRMDCGETAAILIAGDFNCNPDDREMEILERSGFVNLASPFEKNGRGTFRYRGQWNMLDQILVSETMADINSSVYSSDFRIHSNESLLMTDNSWPGVKPYATFDNYRYVGGFSDHLPVLVRLTFSSGFNQIFFQVRD